MKRNYQQEALSKYGSPLTDDQFNEFVESLIAASQHIQGEGDVDELEVKIEEIMDSLEVDSDQSIRGRYQAVQKILSLLRSSSPPPRHNSTGA